MNKSIQFEWDVNKDIINQKKHGISFRVAALVFEDPFLFSKPDDRYGYYEERWVSIGLVEDNVIYVAHTAGDSNEEEIIRIISARKASPRETKRYYLN